MDFNGPIPVTYRSEPSALQKLITFVGCYDCRVYYSDTVWLDLGAGSLMCERNVVSIGPDANGSIGSIGRFCETNASTKILSGGEHRHDLPVNITFTGLGIVPHALGARQLAPTKPISIGNGVVLSMGAKIRSGVKIGDGAVVGADAFVSRDVPAFEIHGGVPARKIGQRAPTLNWWDFSNAYLVEHMENIQDVALSPGPHQWRVQRPRFAIRKTGEDYDILGFVDMETGAVRPISDMPAKVQEYLFQAFSERATYWLADCWAE